MPRNHQRAVAIAFAAFRMLVGRVPVPVLVGVVLLAGAGAWLLPSGTGPAAPDSRLPGGASAPAEMPSAPPTSGSQRTIERGNSAGSRTPSVAQLAAECGLREVGRAAYESPAGVGYRRGSEQGHRLLHLATHVRDNPSRPYKHGVFDGDGLSEAVAIVDEAYEKASAGRGVEVEREGRRTVYRVEMGRRVGFVGGQWGASRGRPAARRVQLVMEGDRLITAYPVK